MCQVWHVKTCAALILLSVSGPISAEEVREQFGSHQRPSPNGGSLLGVPENYMASGYHADENRICGSKLLLLDGSVKSVEGPARLTRNQRFGMLSTDEGNVTVGLHGGTNELLEQPLPGGPTYRYYFSYGDEPWAQFAGMHACRSGDGLVGIHMGQNVFTAVTARTPPMMENEPKSPAQVDVYLDLLACDAPVDPNKVDEIRLFVNGEPLIKEDNDPLLFEEAGTVKSRGGDGFVTKNRKSLGRMLKLGEIKLQGERQRSRCLVVSVIRGRSDANTQQVLERITLLASKSAASDAPAAQFAEAIAKLTDREKSPPILGTCIVGAQTKDESLEVTWLSGDAGKHTVVAASLERQARFYISRDNGQYWAALHAEAK